MGGAVDSTVSLAAQARAAGHATRLIIAAGDSYARRPRLMAGLVRMERASSSLGSVAWRVHDWLSAATVGATGACMAERAGDVPAAVRRLHEPGALLVINSVRQLDLARLLEMSRRSGSPTVWYLREASSLAAVPEHGPQVDTLIANSRPLADQAARLAGRPCHYVPSVISREGLKEPDSREVLLVVNPIPSHGLDLVLSLARMLPDRRFALQESWLLEPETVDALREALADLPNVELRRRTGRSEVFRDARALLLPHSSRDLGDSRPRVALESQLLGIPIVAHDLPGLSAAAASQELLVPEGAPLGAWQAALELLDERYAPLSEAARAFADREMPAPEAVFNAFAAACAPAKISAPG
jgi:glycosyltransferase involved in cell wall biosynthesis